MVELGAGGGMLTRQLARVAGRVVAVEYDPYWALRLRQRFSDDGNVLVVYEDALRVQLPEEPFTVVANVPFCTTTSILHRLLDDPTSPPESVYLVVQKQVALKHARPKPTNHLEDPALEPLVQVLRRPGVAGGCLPSEA